MQIEGEWHFIMLKGTNVCRWGIYFRPISNSHTLTLTHRYV